MTKKSARMWGVFDTDGNPIVAWQLKESAEMLSVDGGIVRPVAVSWVESGVRRVAKPPLVPTAAHAALSWTGWRGNR